jgi:hypothetical protein
LRRAPVLRQAALASRAWAGPAARAWAALSWLGRARPLDRLGRARPLDRLGRALARRQILAAGPQRLAGSLARSGKEAERSTSSIAGRLDRPKLRKEPRPDAARHRSDRWITWPLLQAGCDPGIKEGSRRRDFLMTDEFVQPPCVCCLSSSPSLTSLLPIFFHLARVGEALPANTLHHKHHAVVLLIPSTTPPHLAGPRRWSRHCAVRVQRSEAPPIVALGSDRIARRRR